jgi:5'-3' exonuclease
MDCNSIIYDAVHAMTPEEHAMPHDLFEETLIRRVIVRINEIVSAVQPTNTLYIAFDGVAPFAKMEQQRVRRYKTAFMASLDFHKETVAVKSPDDSSGAPKWSTSSITPGTRFMDLLSSRIEYEYASAGKFGLRDLRVSTSRYAGEGEHKMFHYMRTKKPTQHKERVAVYGLDSDLIMLSVFHCLNCENIWICREAPAFSKTILPRNMDIAPNEMLFLDIRLFSRSILTEMRVNELPGTKEAECRIFDYVFMCFLLGNDFLPHFPALNIRTSGTDRIMDTYAQHIGKYPDRTLISRETRRIQWNWVHLLLSELAKNEHTFFMEEYNIRDKWAKKQWADRTPEDRDTLFQNTPTILRAKELYICPSETHWEERYYQTLFHVERTPESVERICTNYLEGLEWVFRYYTDGCPHWRWKYQWHYPPLLIDLMKHVPSIDDTTLIDRKKGINQPYLPIEQLAYVLPCAQHHLLPVTVQTQLRQMDDYSERYPPLHDLEFEWSFCKYFWESHLKSTQIEPLINIPA